MIKKKSEVEDHMGFPTETPKSSKNQNKALTFHSLIEGNFNLCVVYNKLGDIAIGAV